MNSKKGKQKYNTESPNMSSLSLQHIADKKIEEAMGLLLQTMKVYETNQRELTIWDGDEGYDFTITMSPHTFKIEREEKEVKQSDDETTVMKQNISLLMKQRVKTSATIIQYQAMLDKYDETLEKINERLDSLGTGQTFLANTIDKNINRIDSIERSSEHQNKRIDEKVREFLESKDDIFKRLKEYENKMFELWNEYQDRKDDKIAKEMCGISQTTDEIRKIKVKVIDDFLSTVSEDSLKVLHSLAQRGLELESSDLEFYGFEIA